MKRVILILCVALVGFAHSAKAQWVVTDPTNLVQNIQQVISSSSTLTNMIKNVQETVKIYQQGKEYYDKLKSVHNFIKDARKVQLTVQMIGEITQLYTNGFGRMLSDPNFSVNELAAISNGYTILMQEGGALITEIKEIVTAGNGLSMTDAERMEIIDKIYTKMLSYRNLTRYYTDKHISISFLRSRERGDAERIRALYGSPSERYW